MTKILSTKGPMNDKIELPTIHTKEEALQEILSIATDYSTHLLLTDCVAWLELKMKAIRKIAKKGLKCD